MPFVQQVVFGDTITVILTQGNNKFQFQACDKNGYVSDMQQAFEYGMSLIVCYWGDSYQEMSWLDGKTGCQGACPGTGYVVYSDISIQ